MKTRFGHVSNSSSSSFIVGTDEPLDSEETIKRVIFHNAGENTDGWVSHVYYDDPIHIDRLCAEFMEQVESSGERTFEEFLNNADHVCEQLGWLEKYYGSGPWPHQDTPYEKERWANYDRINELNRQIDRSYDPVEIEKLQAEKDDLHKRQKQLSAEEEQYHIAKGKKILAEKAPQFGGKHIYYVEFGDEDGVVGCHLEHGPHWNNVTHIRISQH